MRLVGVWAIVLLAALVTVTGCASGPPSPTAVPSPAPKFSQGPYDVVCPGVSGGAGPALCSKMAQAAVVTAVAYEGFPITRITFQRGSFCLFDPFHPISCPAPVWPAGTDDLGSALVQFSGTISEGFVNLGVTADGEITTKQRVLSPPAGATPTT